MELGPVVEEEAELEEVYLPPGSPAEYPEKPKRSIRHGRQA